MRQYHLVFDYLTALRNNYLKAHVLFAKNMKKLKKLMAEKDRGKICTIFCLLIILILLAYFTFSMD